MRTTSASLFINKYAKRIDRCFQIPNWRKPSIVIPVPDDDEIDMKCIGNALEGWLGMALTRTGDFPRTTTPSLLYEIYTDAIACDYVRALMRNNRGKDLYSAKTIQACLYFAMCDARVFLPFHILEVVNDAQYLQEMNTLIRAIDLSTLKAFGEPLVKPCFTVQGKKGRIGAVGDFILGTTLIEIKCTVQVDYRSAIRQLLIYYALNKLCKNRRPIHRLGIYHVRHKDFITFRLQRVASSAQLRFLVLMLKRYLGRKLYSYSTE